MKIKGAIFDLDGTLIDSMPFWDTIGEEYLRKRGIVPRLGLKKEIQSLSLQQAACYYQTEYGLTDSCDDIVDGVKIMLADYYTNVVVLKESVCEMLRTFDALGIKMCVATATDKSLAEAALKKNDILHYFQRVFTCDEVGYGKDEPVIYNTALDFLSTPLNQTWVFEDALYAAKTAKTIGLPLVGVYDDAEQQKQALQQLADIYIHNFREMEAFLP